MENWTWIKTKLLTQLFYLVCVNEGDIYLSTTSVVTANNQDIEGEGMKA